MHLISTNEVYDSYFSILNRDKRFSNSSNSNYIIFAYRIIPPSGEIQINSPQIFVKMSKLQDYASNKHK